MANSDGFHVVKSRKRGQKKNLRKPFCTTDRNEICQTVFNVDKRLVLKKMEEKRHELSLSEFKDSYEEVVRIIIRHFVKMKERRESSDCEPREDYNKSEHDVGYRESGVKELICYGIGNFSTCATARYQLAFFLNLRDRIKVRSECTWLYDPVLTLDEKEILTELKVKIISENEAGKRRVTENTVFYMPHCGKALYNNLLWKNWSKERLKKMVIIGNSFGNMKLSIPEREFGRKYIYIHNIVALTEETELKNQFRFQDIFNDTSVHCFSAKSLSAAPEDTWLQDTEPVYDGSDLEIIETTL